MQRAARITRSRLLVVKERFEERRQVANDRTQQYLDAMHETATLKSIPFKRVFFPVRTFRLDYQADAARYRTLR